MQDSFTISLVHLCALLLTPFTLGMLEDSTIGGILFTATACCAWPRLSVFNLICRAVRPLKFLKYF